MKSQNERLLGWLRTNPHGVCAANLGRVYIGRPAARIWDIKQKYLEAGETIEKVQCLDHGHRTYQIRYVLERI